MANVIHWQQCADQAGLVRQAAWHLDRGELVAFPGGLAVSALAADAVDHLAAHRSNDERLVLVLPSAGHALDWLPALSALGHRLARRLWPGPAILLVDGWQEGLASRLNAGVRNRLCADGELAVTVPDQPVWWYTLHLTAGPMVMVPWQEDHNGLAALAIADAIAENVAPSVVRIRGESWELVQAGAISKAELQARARRSIVFVCTGNTCRSPMAAALCRKLLAERLGCPADELANRGYDIGSAGIAAVPGAPAAAEAVHAVRELGGELAGHFSQPLTPELVNQADHLITMTHGHRLAIESRFAGAVPPRTLCPNGRDIADPIGAGPEVYRHCAQQILDHLQHWLGELEKPCV